MRVISKSMPSDARTRPAAPGRTPRASGPRSPVASAASTSPSARALEVTVVPSASAASRGRLRRPPGVVRWAVARRGRVDRAVLDDHQVDRHRQAEDRADQDEEPGLQPAVEQPPDPAPHDDPREHRPGDPPARCRPRWADVAGSAGRGRASPRAGLSSAIARTLSQPRVAGFSGSARRDRRAGVRRWARRRARSRAAGSRPSGPGPRSRAGRRRRRPRRAPAGRASRPRAARSRTAKKTTALTRNVPSAAGSVSASSIRPAQAMTRPDTQKKAVTTAAPTSTPSGGRPAADQAGDRGGDRPRPPPVTRAPTRRKERSQGTLAARPAPAGGHRGTGRRRSAAGAGPAAGAGAARRCAAPGRSGASARLRSRCAASSAARASRAARRARGLSTTTTPTTSSTRDGDEQLRPAAGDRQRDRAEGEQRRPEVHDQHRAAVRVPDREQPVVQVHLVRRERRLAACGCAG